MKRMIAAMLLITAVVVGLALAVDYEDRPAYTNGQYYVFSTSLAASNALDGVNSTNWFPITGNNAATGQPATNKQKTTCWVEAPEERLDGKWVFPRIPETRLDAMAIPEAVREAWWSNNVPDVEMYATNWFPEVEE